MKHLIEFLEESITPYISNFLTLLNLLAFNETLEDLHSDVWYVFIENITDEMLKIYIKPILMILSSFYKKKSNSFIKIFIYLKNDKRYILEPIITNYSFLWNISLLKEHLTGFKYNKPNIEIELRQYNEFIQSEYIKIIEQGLIELLLIIQNNRDYVNIF